MGAYPGAVEAALHPSDERFSRKRDTLRAALAPLRGLQLLDA